MFAWTAIETVTADYVWIAIYGLFGAGILGLFPATLASLSPDPTKNGTRIGMVFTIVGVAAVTGPPLAGRIIALADRSYVGVQAWAGTCLLLGAGLLMVARWLAKK